MWILFWLLLKSKFSSDLLAPDDWGRNFCTPSWKPWTCQHFGSINFTSLNRYCGERLSYFYRHPNWLLLAWQSANDKSLQDHISNLASIVKRVSIWPDKKMKYGVTQKSLGHSRGRTKYMLDSEIKSKNVRGEIVKMIISNCPQIRQRRRIVFQQVMRKTFPCQQF